MTSTTNESVIDVRVDTIDEAVDWVCSVLAANGYAGEVTVDALDPVCEPIEDHRLWAFRVGFTLPSDRQGKSLVARLVEALAPLQRLELVGPPHVRVLDEPRTGFATPSATHRRIGQRLVIAADDRESSPNDVTVRIAPSLAFGSGLHPATAACLELIERHVAPGTGALDLGSGTGVLSVALAKLGARVLALDNDPIAVQATRETVARNDVARRVTVGHGSLGRGADLGHWMGWSALDAAPAIDDVRFDLIVANILARIHIALADDYRRALGRAEGRRGTLLTGGFTVDQEETVAVALGGADFEPIDRVQRGDYVALAHRLAG